MSFTTQVLFIIGILSFGRNAFANIRGTPGIDYPTYSSIPRTSFKCSEQDQVTGFYADPETRCQVFHYCYEHRQETFMCPIGTTFNQAINSCDYWYSSECDTDGVLQIAPEETRNVFNDQPFVPVTRPPHNVFEKIIALRDSNGNLYEQDDESVYDPEDSKDIIPENNLNYDFNGEDQDKSDLSNLEEMSEADQQDVNFVPYDLDTTNVEDIEIVLSSNKQHNNPTLDYEKEDYSYSQEDFNVSDEPENFEVGTEEVLQRIYQKDYSSDNQVKEILDIDPYSLNQDVSDFELNSDAMLLKRFSEVETKKRKIRRKPKYVVLQTNFEENPESQTMDPSSETSSSENKMMTYALDTGLIDSNENAVDAVQIEYGESKRNRKPLSRDYSYSVDESPFTNKLDGNGESSEYQSDQTETENDFNEIENSNVLQSSDANLDLYEFENANDFNAGQENDNINFLVEDFDSNNFPLSDENFLENQQLNLEEQMEAGKSLFESDAMNSDEINELLSNTENSYELREFDSGESDFMEEHTEETLVIGDEFSNSENDANSIEGFDLNESSDSYSSTSDVPDSENLNYLGNDIVVSEFEESQNDQTNLYVEESASKLSDVANNENNVYLESGDAVDLNENRYFEDTNIKSESYENSDFRVNSKYLNLTAELERSALNKTGEDYIKDEIPITGSEITNFEDTHTEEEINIDSLEYFENEGQGYFMDEYGRIYILSGENEGSETLIYVGDVDPHANSETDGQDIYTPQTENSLLETTPTVEGSYVPTESEDSVEDDFDSMEFGEEVEEFQGINELVAGDSEPVFGEDDGQSHAENLIPEKEDNVSNFPDIEETLVEHNSTIVFHTLEETGVFHSNLSQVNETSHHPIDTAEDFFKDGHHFELEGVKNSPNKEKEVIEEPGHKSVEMVQDTEKTKGPQFHISSIPLPANDYEKGLYDERVKYSQGSNTINNNAFPATFYKQLQAVPLLNKNKPGGSKTIRGDSDGAELLNIKTRLFQNVKSDLASDEVKSAVAEVGFPSKIMNNLFSSFYSPFQSVQGNVDGNFPLHSPKFRNMPGFPKRTGKMFKPAKVFKLINFGKKLLKMKQIKLNSFREYLGS